MPDNERKQNPPQADKIFLRALRLSCLIGIDAAEQHTKQAVVMDVEITPLVGDNGDNKVGGGEFIPAVDYAILTKRLREWAENNRHRYLEGFAAAAAELIINEFAVNEVRITAAKPRPFPGLDQFATEVTRTKE